MPKRVRLKRVRLDYSLWPERARPERAPLASAVGGFAIGVVFVVAAYNSVPDAGIARTGQETPKLTGESDVEHAPVFKYAVAAKPAIPFEIAG